MDIRYTIAVLLLFCISSLTAASLIRQPNGVRFENNTEFHQTHTHGSTFVPHRSRTFGWYLVRFSKKSFLNKIKISKIKGSAKHVYAGSTCEAYDHCNFFQLNPIHIERHEDKHEIARGPSVQTSARSETATVSQLCIHRRKMDLSQHRPQKSQPAQTKCPQKSGAHFIIYSLSPSVTQETDGPRCYTLQASD